MRCFYKLLVIVFISMCAASTLLAEEPDAEQPDVMKRAEFDAPALTSTWIVRLGGSMSADDTTLAWSPKGLGGTIILVEDTLGLDESDGNFFLGVAYHFNRRHSVELMANQVKRSAKRILDEEIEWGDYIFRAQGEIESELNVGLLGLKYKYDFSDSGRLNSGFSVGLSTFDIEAMIAGEARIDDGTGEEWIEGIVEGADVIAPVPQIGFFLDYAATAKWLIRFSTEILDLNISGHSGRVLQSSLAAEYWFTGSFGASINLSSIDLEYRGEKSHEKFGVAYKVNSLGAYLSWAF